MNNVLVKMFNYKFEIVRCIYGLLLIILTSGCAVQVQSTLGSADKMAVQHEISSLDINSQLKNNIHLYDVLSDEKDSSWSYNLNIFEFKTALNQSLINADYLGNPLASDYDLKVKLLDLDKPFAGINLTVTTTVEYILKERNSGNEIFKEIIVESYTAKFTEATNAAVRLSLAIEGSARKNIHEFLKFLSKIKKKNDQTVEVLF